MKFSEKWLREWVDPPVSTDELVEQLTMAGLEVDAVEPAGAGLESLLVGEVVAVDKHPDADKLRVCSVLAGKEPPLQIVCGAPNVSVGGKYPLAPVGYFPPTGSWSPFSLNPSPSMCTKTLYPLGTVPRTRQYQVTRKL